MCCAPPWPAWRLPTPRVTPMHTKQFSPHTRQPRMAHRRQNYTNYTCANCISQPTVLLLLNIIHPTTGISNTQIHKYANTAYEYRWPTGSRGRWAWENLEVINYQTTANCLVFLPALFTHLHTYISTDLPTYLPDHCKLPWFLPGKSSALFTYLPTCISTDLPTYLHTYLPNCMDTYIPTYTPKLQWNLHISWGNASGLAMMKIRISVGTFGSGQL